MDLQVTRLPVRHAEGERVADQRLDVVGLRDIARMLEVDGRTPTTWRRRNVLPPEDGYISGSVPVWHRERILAWAEATGRLPGPTADGPGPVGLSRL